jgi:hypothetical protein
MRPPSIKNWASKTVWPFRFCFTGKFRFPDRSPFFFFHLLVTIYPIALFFQGALMEQVIAEVKRLLEGSFFVKDATSHIRKLESGDMIHIGDRVFGAQDNPLNAGIVIEVTFEGIGDILLTRNGALTFDPGVLEGIFGYHSGTVAINADVETYLRGLHTGDADNR